MLLGKIYTNSNKSSLTLWARCFEEGSIDTRLNMEERAKGVGTEGSVVCVALRCTWGVLVAVMLCMIYCYEVQGLLM